jgi:hypothetical protein
MTIEEIQNLKPGDEIARDDGAVGFVMAGRPGGRITVRWVDTKGRGSNETLEPFRLISMARGAPPPPAASNDDKLVRVRVAR